MQFTSNSAVAGLGQDDRCHTLMYKQPPKKTKTGRPKEEVKAAAFLRVATYLEDDGEQMTVGDLLEMMQEYLSTEYQPCSIWCT